jgi:hypothetical protein
MNETWYSKKRCVCMFIDGHILPEPVYANVHKRDLVHS